ncbi:hypothetical protein BH11PSE10_BH11PSE10_10720 [soil metagenome]
MNEAAPTVRLLLELHFGPGELWTAQLELPDGSVRRFNSPFELARFVVQRPSSITRPPSTDHGLR